MKSRMESDSGSIEHSSAALTVEHIVGAVVGKVEIVALQQRDALRKVEASAATEFATNLGAVVLAVLVVALGAQAVPFDRRYGAHLHSSSTQATRIAKTLAVRVALRTKQTTLRRHPWHKGQPINRYSIVWHIATAATTNLPSRKEAISNMQNNRHQNKSNNSMRPLILTANLDVSQTHKY